MGGALSDPELLCERKCERAYGERLRVCGRWRGENSEDGSVWERGVIGRLDVELSSDELLSWRARMLPSPMVSVSSGCAGGVVPKSERVAVSCIEGGGNANDLVGLRAGGGSE
jgi:hypothetical protein